MSQETCWWIDLEGGRLYKGQTLSEQKSPWLRLIEPVGADGYIGEDFGTADLINK